MSEPGPDRPMEARFPTTHYKAADRRRKRYGSRTDNIATPPRLMIRSIPTKITETTPNVVRQAEVHARRNSRCLTAREKDEKAMPSEANQLDTIREKVEAGKRLSFEDGLALEASNDLFALGSMADLVRERYNANFAY